MTEAAGPDQTASAGQVGFGAREAAAPPPGDAASRAEKTGRLQAAPRHEGCGANVAARKLTGPVQGFGKMWQKTYRMNAGQVPPEQAIATWREHFPEFWPKGNRFAAALTGLSPGDVALLCPANRGGVKLSTGVFVLCADTESFTLMNPLGDMFAGWITFSAERKGDATTVQAQVLMRANDPLYEIGMALGGHRKEDKFWAATLTALGRRLGIGQPAVEIRSTCVDSRRQWRHARNVRHNSMVRSELQTLVATIRRGSGG